MKRKDFIRIGTLGLGSFALVSCNELWVFESGSGNIGVLTASGSITGSTSGSLPTGSYSGSCSGSFGYYEYNDTL